MNRLAERKFEEIEVGSPEHREELALRLDVLRAPLGLCFEEHELEREPLFRHFGLFEEGHLSACVLLEPLPGRSLRLLELAVQVERQRAGRGRALVGFAESFARAMGYSEIHMHARESAAPFYLKLGYAVEGDSFIEFTIPFFLMHKKL